MVRTQKPRLLVVSHVNPVPRQSGQQQRVHYTLVALKRLFHVTFVGFVDATRVESTKSELERLCDEVLLLSSAYTKTPASRLWHRAAGWLYQKKTGLKFSNYLIGKVELGPKRVSQAISGRSFDLALIEYFHATESAVMLRRRGVACVLDTHNILWQSFARQLDARGVRGESKRLSVERYREAEESAWAEFDGLIAISAGERDYLRTKLIRDQCLFYAPMGIPLESWPYSWTPSRPVRLAYYGGLGSSHNAQDARRCHDRIMPLVWQEFPEAELWLIGSNPPSELRLLEQQDNRVKVTGFVENVQEVLKTVSVLLCPFTGTYGFRSRIVEAMALGVPVVATPDAVFGMDLDPGRGLFLEQSDTRMADAAVKILAQEDLAAVQSREARNQIEQHYSFENSYGRLASEMLEFAGRRKQGSKENDCQVSSIIDRV